MAIFIEFKLLSIKGYFNPIGTVYCILFDLPNSYITNYKRISKSTILVMVIGTLIWGFGDVIYKFI